MKFSSFLKGVGVGAGVTAAYLFYQKEKDVYIEPATAFHNMKKAASKYGITGDSWICEFVEKKEWNGTTHPFYKGGFTQLSDGEPADVTYFIHAKTGEVLESDIA